MVSKHFKILMHKLYWTGFHLKKTAIQNMMLSSLVEACCHFGGVIRYHLQVENSLNV